MAEFPLVQSGDKNIVKQTAADEIFSKSKQKNLQDYHTKIKNSFADAFVFLAWRMLRLKKRSNLEMYSCEQIKEMEQNISDYAQSRAILAIPAFIFIPVFSWIWTGMSGFPSWKYIFRKTQLKKLYGDDWFPIDIIISEIQYWKR